MEEKEGQVFLPELQTYVPLPGGYANWTNDQQWKWRSARVMQLQIHQRAAATVLATARREKFAPPDFEPGEPGVPVIIRAFYGPLKNVDAVTLLIADHDSRLEQLRCPGVFLRDDAPVVRLVKWSGPLNKGTKLAFNYGFGGDFTAPVDHDPEVWGPRRFTWEMLNQISKAGGRATLYLTHADLVVNIDEAAFLRWRAAFEASPETALLEARHLLTGGAE